MRKNITKVLTAQKCYGKVEFLQYSNNYLQKRHLEAAVYAGLQRVL